MLKAQASCDAKWYTWTVWVCCEVQHKRSTHAVDVRSPPCRHSTHATPISVTCTPLPSAALEMIAVRPFSCSALFTGRTRTTTRMWLLGLGAPLRFEGDARDDVTDCGLPMGSTRNELSVSSALLVNGTRACEPATNVLHVTYQRNVMQLCLLAGEE